MFVDFSCSWFARQLFVLAWLVLAHWLQPCQAVCSPAEDHLNCLSIDLMSGFKCRSSSSAGGTTCKDVSRLDSLPDVSEWIAADRERAWISIELTREYSITKLIIQQRKSDAAQIKTISIEFDRHPKIEACLRCNLANSPTFDEITFPARRTENIKITVLSMHTLSGEYPGFQFIKAFDENCDRGYQAINAHVQPRSDSSTEIRSWTRMYHESSLKMIVQFHEQLNVVFAYKPNAVTETYRVSFDMTKKEMNLFQTVYDGKTKLLSSVTNRRNHSNERKVLWFYFYGTKILVGDSLGVMIEVSVAHLSPVRYWGVSTSSLKPISLTFWKPVGLCHSTADYYWLADKTLGGTTITELQKGLDGKVMNFRSARMLPSGPHIDGLVSSALFFDGTSTSGAHLATFKEGCLHDLSLCSEGITIALWVALYDKYEFPNPILRLEGDYATAALITMYKLEKEVRVKVRDDSSLWMVRCSIERTSWHYIVIMWDKVRGLLVIVDNVNEYSALADSFSPLPTNRNTNLILGMMNLVSPERNSRVAIRDVAVWKRRLSVAEIHQVYHCNNYGKTREFLTNQRAPVTAEGAIPFPGENVVAPKNGGHCSDFGPAITFAQPCSVIIDGTKKFKGHSSTVWVELSFARAFVVNKVKLLQSPIANHMAMTFSDGEVAEFPLLPYAHHRQEVSFTDKSTSKIKLAFTCDGTQCGTTKVEVYYDFSRDMTPSPVHNLAAWSAVKKSGSVKPEPEESLPSSITDGFFTTGDTLEIELPINPASLDSNGFSTVWIKITFVDQFLTNLLRLWMPDDILTCDHVKTALVQFSDASHATLHFPLPAESTGYYWNEFVFSAVQTNWIKLHLAEAYESTNKKICLKEMEVFHDSSKDLPASYTIVDKDGNLTPDTGLSNVQLGSFDFLFETDIQAVFGSSFISRLFPGATIPAYALKLSDSGRLYFKANSFFYLWSVSQLTESQWYHIKVFYSVKETKLSMFIDNRLDASEITDVYDEYFDDYYWHLGIVPVKNFKVYHGIRGVGMETVKIPDSALTASSEKSPVFRAAKARLNNDGAWYPSKNDLSQYLQVDLGMPRRIACLSFQGYGNAWIKSAQVSYGSEELEWQYFGENSSTPKTFMISTDANSVAMVMLYRITIARYLRIHPVSWNGGIALRMEVYEFDYGQWHDTMLSVHASYYACVSAEGLDRTFPQSSFSTHLATPADCQHACYRNQFGLVALYHGRICICIEKIPSKFVFFPEAVCSTPCSGNRVDRCGGKSYASIYASLKGSSPVETFISSHSTLEILADEVVAGYREVNIVVKSLDGHPPDLDVSFDGVHFPNTKTASFNQAFTKFGKCYVVVEEAGISDAAYASTSTSVLFGSVRFNLNCPDSAVEGETFSCIAYAQVYGAETTCSLNGEDFPLQLEDSMFVTTGDVTLAFSVVNDSYGASSTYILSNYVFLKRGIVRAFDAVTSGPGSLTIQIFRPTCPGTGIFCQTTVSCVSSIKACPRGNQPRTSTTFPSTETFCEFSDPSCPTRTPIVPPDLSLVYEQTATVTESGLNTIAATASFDVEAGDYLAFTDSDILVHQATGNMFRTESVTTGLGATVSTSSLVPVENRQPLLRAHYSLHLKTFFNLNQTGRLECSASSVFGFSSDFHIIKLLQAIKDVFIIAPNISASNEPVLFTVPPHPGTNIQYEGIYGDGEQFGPVFPTGDNQSFSVNHTYVSSGYVRLTLLASNKIGQYNVSHDLLILDPVMGLDWNCLSCVTINKSIVITWTATQGQNISVIVRFGDGNSAVTGPYNFTADELYSVEHTYETSGEYNISLEAFSSVSFASLTGQVFVLMPLENLTVEMNSSDVTIGNSSVFIVNEMVTILANVSRGTDPKYSAIFACLRTGDQLPEQVFIDDILETTFKVPCVYDIYVLAYNNISRVWWNGTVTVESYVIENLRVTVPSISPLGEPTMLTAEVDSGILFNCTWGFGDGTNTTTDFDSFGRPVYYTYLIGGEYNLTISCSNHFSNASASALVVVLLPITSLEMKAFNHVGDTGSSLSEQRISGYGPNEDFFALEYPVLFTFLTDGNDVSYSIEYGDFSPPVSTGNSSVGHQFPGSGTYTITLNASNAISHKVVSISISLLSTVRDIVISSHGPVQKGKEMLFETTIGQVGSASCYYFNLGDGTEFLYKDTSQTTCLSQYDHVTDIRIMPPKTKTVTFGHAYANVTVYDVRCTGSNLVSNATSSTQAVVVPTPCSAPMVKIDNLGESVSVARVFMRSEAFEVSSTNSISCEATSETEFLWEILRLTEQDTLGEEVLLSETAMNGWKLVVQPRSLAYGVYRVIFTLSMVGVEGVSSSTFGHLEIIPSPLIAEVRGGSSRRVGFNKMVLLEGGFSRDPDVEEGSLKGMTFFWSCKRSDDDYTFSDNPHPPQPNNTREEDLIDYGGCFGNGPGRLNYSNSTYDVNLDTGLMLENMSYVIQLLVKKDSRKSVFNLFLEVIPGDPPTVQLECLKNCFPKFNPSIRVSLKVTCQDCRNMYALNYRWQVFVNATNEDGWMSVDNLPEIILTRASSPNLVIKDNMLEGNRKYKIRVEVWRPGGIPGVAEVPRTVNTPPSGGWCVAEPRAGFALDTLFSLNCEGWLDDNLPLKYKFSYVHGSDSLESLFYVGESSRSPNVTFPIGQKSNYTLDIIVIVADAFGAESSVTVPAQVKPTSADELSSELERLTSPNGTIGTMLSSGDTQAAMQVISATATMLNFEFRSGTEETDGSDVKISGATNAKSSDISEESKQIRSNLVTMISTATITTLDDAHRTSAVLNAVTLKTTEVSPKAQETATSTFETVVSVLVIEANKKESNPSAVEKTAVAVLSGLGNVLSAAFPVIYESVVEKNIVEQDESETESEESHLGNTEAETLSPEEETTVKKEEKRKEELGNKLWFVIETVAKAVTVTKVPGEEPTTIETPHLSLEVYRESPEELNYKVLKAGAGSFELPHMGSTLNESEAVDVSTVATPSNPFPDEANRIKTVVMTTELRSISGVIAVANLGEPINIRLPRDPKPVLSERPQEITAARMIFYKFDMKHNDSSLNVDLHLSGNCSERTNFSLFLRKGLKPSELIYDFNTTLPEASPRVNVSTKSTHTFFLSNLEFNRTAAGRYFLGLVYNRADEQCPDAMNYTIQFYTSGCLYWNMTSKAWRGDGCWVGPLTNLNETQCLCNHLTSFGGDFVVAPNSIDWNAVGAGFTNLSDNPVVFAVVMSIIGLYFILLVWTRRMDKKDLKEFVSIPLPDNDPRDSYLYEVIVYTGHSKYSGTTAKITIVVVGSRDETGPRALEDPTSSSLKRGRVDTFILSVPSTLGRLSHIRVWHDNAGESPSWYLCRIMIRDLQTNRKTWFLCDQWFAVEEDDGLIERILPVATKDDLVSFNFLFSIEARRKLVDDHLWFSVLARRPRNQFTRAQRVTCCLCFLLSSMLANAMFYETDGTSSSGNEVRAGPIVFSAKQLWIAFISGMVVLPINVLIVYIFRNVRPRSSERTNAENTSTRITSAESMCAGSTSAESTNAESTNAGTSRTVKEPMENEMINNETISDKEKTKSSCSKESLPRKFICVAYLLAFVTVSVSATFTIFYGFTFGKEKSERWISSTMLSFFQDLLLLQPLKVFAAATFIALIIKDPNKVDQGDKSDDKPELVEQVDDSMRSEEEAMPLDESSGTKTPRVKSPRVRCPTSVVKPPSEADLAAVRELRKKQKKMRRIISEICWYIAYLTLISIVAYGNRDPKAYYVTRAMSDLFVENKYTTRLTLDDVSSLDNYWNWLYNSIIPAINTPYWYGPYGLEDIETISKTSSTKSRGKAKAKSTKTKASGSSVSGNLAVYYDYPEGFTADRAVSLIVGQARARQLRNTRPDTCDVHPAVERLLRGCSQEYSWSNEDEGCYGVSWTSLNESKDECKQSNPKSPWSYNTAWDLKGTPFWGKFHNYWGGGFVQELGLSLSSMQQESKRLEQEGWIDHSTRAIFLEFTIYNAFTNFFCAVTLLFERRVTGGVYPYGQLNTLKLYHYTGGEAIVTLVCEIIFVGVLCYNLYREMKEARVRGVKNYFKDPWNYFDILGLVFSFTAVALFFVRMAATSVSLDRINEDHARFVSFHYISAIDQSFTALMGLAVFVYFMKLLRLLRFNRKISLLSTTLIACTETLVGFLLVYVVLFAAYAQLMFLVYGRDLEEYASYPRCLSSLMEMTLGVTDFEGLKNVNRILTGFIFFSYTFLNVCVYMNLFISILSEKFSEVRADASLQPNDYEIVDFMILSLKKALGSSVGPATQPIYKEAKDKIDRGVEKIGNTSESIQSAIQVMCKEDIRQTLWFNDKNKVEEKKLLLGILLETGELWTEEDIGSSVPLFDAILTRFNTKDLLRIRENNRLRMAEEEMEKRNMLADWLDSVNESSLNLNDSCEASTRDANRSFGSLSDGVLEAVSVGEPFDVGRVNLPCVVEQVVHGEEEVVNGAQNDEDWKGFTAGFYNNPSSDDCSDRDSSDVDGSDSFGSGSDGDYDRVGNDCDSDPNMARQANEDEVVSDSSDVNGENIRLGNCDSDGGQTDGENSDCRDDDHSDADRPTDGLQDNHGTQESCHNPSPRSDACVITMRGDEVRNGRTS